MTPFNRNIYHWLLYSRGTAGLNYVDEEYGGMDRLPPGGRRVQGDRE